mgnify:CR=1 FL=1
MTDGLSSFHITTASRIAAVPAAAWDACAGGDNPFVAHAFLNALENSGSVAPSRGWQPRHVLLYGSGEAAGDLLGAVPLYVKTHSFGEYVFDWAWADAYERAGGRYYPKLQAAVPFTPVTGPRLLVRGDLPPARRAAVADALAEGLIRLAERDGVSSLHVTFPHEGAWQRLGGQGLLQRTGIQFHFTNPGYASFEDFLGALVSRKRKQIRRERREVRDSGLRLRRLTGADLQPRHWDAFYDFYCATADKRWGVPYLEPAFFHEIGETMPERILLVLAEEGPGRPVAGALNLIGADALYGRNWGCAADYSFLHFEACYYQAIEHALDTGLARVEAGAQGEHKIQRGYLPVATYSAHWIADPGLAAPVADFLRRERAAVDRQIVALNAESPFRAEG